MGQQLLNSDDRSCGSVILRQSIRHGASQRAQQRGQIGGQAIGPEHGGGRQCALGSLRVVRARERVRFVAELDLRGGRSGDGGEERELRVGPVGGCAEFIARGRRVVGDGGQRESGQTVRHRGSGGDIQDAGAVAR